MRWDVATVFPNLQLTDIIPIIPPLEPVTPINIADAHYGWTLVRFRVRRYVLLKSCLPNLAACCKAQNVHWYTERKSLYSLRTRPPCVRQ